MTGGGEGGLEWISALNVNRLVGFFSTSLRLSGLLIFRTVPSFRRDDGGGYEVGGFGIVSEVTVSWGGSVTARGDDGGGSEVGGFGIVSEVTVGWGGSVTARVVTSGIVGGGCDLIAEKHRGRGGRIGRGG